MENEEEFEEEEEEDFIDNGTPKKKYPEKIKIIITNFDYDGKRCKFADNVFNGHFYTDVGFSANRYGFGSPCINEDEIKKSVESCKKWIIQEGDIPIIEDLRNEIKTKQNTLF